MTQSPQLWENIRLQFDALPYPNRPLDEHPRNDPDILALHNLVIPYYRRYHRVTEAQGKWILDAGCGSGYKLLALALANPGATLVGVDISPKSLELAQQRLTYHGIENPVEFYCLSVEELPQFEARFDYINCDEVLYLLSDPAAGLQAMQAVLKPEGIIRVNMHSALQRADFFRTQAFFRQLGLLEGPPSPEHLATARETMGALNNWVLTKKQSWRKEFETDDEVLQANCLLRGDKGITMQEFSGLLRQANLEFISMVHWRQWNLENLFKSIEDLPISVALGIAEMSLEEQLYLYELLHPYNRLLDLYCGHPGQVQDRAPSDEWTDDQWRTALIHLHPQLQTRTFRETLAGAAVKLGMLSLDQVLKMDEKTFVVDSTIATTCLYPLLEHPQPFSTLLDRWLQVRPLDLITLQPIDPDRAFENLRYFLQGLETSGYLLVELQPEVP